MTFTIRTLALFLCAITFSISAMADNVMEANITKIDVDDAPRYIQQQAKTIISQCTTSENNLSQVTIYHYSNSGTKQDNYILDFSALTGQTKQQTGCTYHSPVCGPKGCFIMAYTQINKSDWEQTWYGSALNVKIITIQQSNKSFPAVAVTQTAENCMSVNEGKEPCPIHFTWKDKKFKYFGHVKLEDIEAGSDGNAATPAAPAAEPAAATPAPSGETVAPPAPATPVEPAPKPADE